MPAGPPPSTTTSWSWRTGILRSGSWMKSVIAVVLPGSFSGLRRGGFVSRGSKIADLPQRKWRSVGEKPEHYTARRGSEARIVTRPSEFLGRARKNNRAQQESNTGREPKNYN